MGKDPAFLFYPGDWLGGTMGMSFEQKGAYFELLVFQFNNGPFTEAQAKQVLSICEASVWLVVCKKFNFDPQTKTFSNARLTDEMAKRQKFSESRRKNAKSQKAYAKHMENENRNENEVEIENKDEFEILEKYEKWTIQILDNNDAQFEQQFMNEGLKMSPETLTHWVRDHMGLICRYPKMRPPDQQRFRKSCLKHIRENYKKQINGNSNVNGTNKNQQHLHTLATDYAARYGPDDQGK